MNNTNSDSTNQSNLDGEGQSLRPYEADSSSISNQADDSSEELTTTGGFAEALDEAGLTDDNLAGGLTFIATNATKTISLGQGETLDVPDYNVRLAAITTAMKAKGHLSEQKQGAMKAKKHIQYILK